MLYITVKVNNRYSVVFRSDQIVRDTGLTTADAWALADDRSTWIGGRYDPQRLRLYSKQHHPNVVSL